MYASPRSSPSTSQHSLPGGRYPLPGPDFHRLELASFPGAPKIGSSTSSAAVMQTRSRTLEMPSGLSLPLAFGIYTFNCAENLDRLAAVAERQSEVTLQTVRAT